MQCFDTVYTDLKDMDGFRKDVENIHLMGFDGKSIINPRQIPIVHEIFTPTQKDIIFAEKVVKEIDSKKALGIGVFTVDGKMIDIAFYDGAKRTIDLPRHPACIRGICNYVERSRQRNSPKRSSSAPAKRSSQGNNYKDARPSRSQPEGHPRDAQ